MHGFGHNHLHYAVSNVVFPGLYQQKGTRDAGRGLPLANPKLAMTGEVLDCLEAGSHVERICFFIMHRMQVKSNSHRGL